MQEKVYKKRIKDIDELRASILAASDEMDLRIIDAAIRQWRTRRLRTCIITAALKPKVDTLNTH